MDLEEIGTPASIFLQIEVGDSLESEAMILCSRGDRRKFDAATGAPGKWLKQYLFRSWLDQVINMDHALAKLADDRLGISGREVRRGLRRAGDPQAHLQPQRRGGVEQWIENPYTSTSVARSFFSTGYRSIAPR